MFGLRSDSSCCYCAFMPDDEYCDSFSGSAVTKRTDLGSLCWTKWRLIDVVKAEV